MFLEMAIGDALGAGYEFCEIPEEIPLRYVSNPKWKQVPGTYTDDTQMSIALAHLLMSKDPATWTHMDVASEFIAQFRVDPREAYASGFYRILTKMTSGQDFLSRVIPSSTRNGGAMRAPVLGIIPDARKCVQAARFQASLTHCTPVGMDAAVGAALMVHYLYYNLGPKELLPIYLGNRVPDISWDLPWEGKVGLRGDKAVRAALTSILSCDTLTESLRVAIGFGGDTDTVAAIAMAAGSLCNENDLPDSLLQGLEHGPFGIPYLEALDSQIAKMFPRPTKQ